MTLRLRLVLALLALVTVGLVVFGATTYSLYSRSEYQRLDDQLRNAAPDVSRALGDQAEPGGRPGGPGGPGGRPGVGRGRGGPDVPLSVYGELRDTSGALVTTVHLATTTNTPKLPAQLAVTGGVSRLFNVGSATGSGTWRVLVTPAQGPGGDAGRSVVVAVPTATVSAALHRLVLLEVIGGLGLLAVLSAGAWFIVRRGLRPLESMATTASAISAGDLTPRVAVTDDSSEVGQLGIAFNTMLDGIQAAFAERDATEARLRQFLADASHELRTPLTSIQGFAELSRVGGAESGDVPTILRRIEDESARMSLLVEDLLLLARLDQTRPAQRAPVDLTVLAADACTAAAAAAPDRAIILDAPAPVVVAGDEAHLRQAIGNLVTNAIKHTPDGSAIDVRTAIDGDTGVVVVRDHGVGLNDDALAQAFDRFWQADAARVGSGAGLGLAIVAGIAAEHGGSASVANAEDGGAVFTLRVPLTARSSSSA